MKIKVNLELNNTGISVEIASKFKKNLANTFFVEIPEGFILDFLPTDPRYIADLIRIIFAQYKIPTKHLSLNFLMPKNLFVHSTFLLPQMDEKYIEKEVILAFQEEQQLDPWDYTFAWSDKSEHSPSAAKEILVIFAVAYLKEHLLLFEDLASFLGKNNKVNFIYEHHFAYKRP